jgi:TPR repeat protein
MKTTLQHWWTILALLVALVAGAFYLPGFVKARSLHFMPHGFKKFDLADPLPNCARWKEHMPAARDPTAYRLYIEARKTWRSKMAWQLTRDETSRILADVSRAADMGDWGARALLAHFYLYGLGPLESNHVLDANPEKAVAIQRMAAKELQPWALYDLGVAYEHGYGGVPYDEDIAWAYYLRAAQLGSPEAQMALATAYSKAGRLDDEEQMQKCAYSQGHGPAAYELAMLARIRDRFEEAIQIYQAGVRFGSSGSAASLWLLFDDGHWANANDVEREALKQLGIKVDIERSRRYRSISEALKVNPDLKLGRLDSVLPLPPAQLPAWSGIDDAREPESNGLPTY